MRVLIVVNASVELAMAKTMELQQWLRQRGIDSLYIAGGNLPLHMESNREEFAIMENVDLVVSLGGDGTLLSSVQLVLEKKVPILGVNFGTLGFLTATRADNLFDAMQDYLDGKLEIESRCILDVVIEGTNGEVHKVKAFNDVSMTRAQYGKMLKFDTLINGDRLAHTRADGIVISSPSGSTAYSLSAGGPIMSPDISCMIVTALAPHSLVSRSYVASAKDVVEIIVPHDRYNTDCGVFVDGHNISSNFFPSRVRAEVVEDAVLLVRCPDRSFAASAGVAFFGGKE